MLLSVLTLGACSSKTDDPVGASPAVVNMQVGQTFDLKVGQTAQIGQLQIAFRGVSQDSRCAVDVTCVWAGDATIKIDATYARMAWTPFELHTGVDPRSTRFRENTITVVGLKPATRSGQNIPAENYVVTLRVD